MMGKEAEVWQERLWGKLMAKIASINSQPETKKILENLISDHEKKTILRRLAVKALIQSGKTYQEIAEILWVSPQTISITKKNVLNNLNSYKSYKRFYGGPIKYSGLGEVKMKKSFLEKLEELLEGVDLWDIITNPPRPPGIGLKNK